MLVTTPGLNDQRNPLTSGAARSIRIVKKDLYEAIQDSVSTWRSGRYPCAEYPTIAEILDCPSLQRPDVSYPIFRHVRVSFDI